MRKARRSLAALLLLVLLPPAQVARTANPATVSVTVTIQSLSVSASGSISFGTVTAGSQTVSSSASTVTNDGTVTETLSLSLIDPAGWTAVQAAPSAPEEYALLAQFSSAAPLAASFTYLNHALSTTSVASTLIKFAGDLTGLSLAPAASRSLWLLFNAPTSTSVTTQQTITVIVTAVAG